MTDSGSTGWLRSYRVAGAGMSLGCPAVGCNRVNSDGPCRRHRCIGIAIRAQDLPGRQCRNMKANGHETCKAHRYQEAPAGKARALEDAAAYLQALSFGLRNRAAQMRLIDDTSNGAPRSGGPDDFDK